MKIREGFVSNSSSSSFVITTKGDEAKAKINIEIDLMQYVKEEIKTIDKLNKIIFDEYGYEADNPPDWYQDALKAIQEGKTLCMGKFSNQYGDELEEFLCYNGITNIEPIDEIKVLEGEGGF